MSFNSIDFYHLAIWLDTQQDSNLIEARMRTIISKAYYGAFLFARDKAGITDNSGYVHELVQKHYYAVKKSKLANDLNKLRFERNKADYKLNQTITPLNAKNALSISRNILKNLGATLN